MLFVDDAAIAAHSQQRLQTLLTRFAEACSFSVSPLAWGRPRSWLRALLYHQISIDGYELEAVHHPGSTIRQTTCPWAWSSTNVLGRPHQCFPHLTTHVWRSLSSKTKMAVYNAWVLNVLLYGSGTWTTYVQQERKFGTFHLRCLRRILHISWQDRVLGQHRRPLSWRPTQHVHYPQATPSALAAWALCAAWRTVVFPRIYSMVNWWQDRRLKATHRFVTRTSVSETWKCGHQRWHLGRPGCRPLPMEKCPSVTHKD